MYVQDQQTLLGPGTHLSSPSTALAVWQPLTAPTITLMQTLSAPAHSSHFKHPTALDLPEPLHDSQSQDLNSSLIFSNPTSAKYDTIHDAFLPVQLAEAAYESAHWSSQVQSQWQNSTCPISDPQNLKSVVPLPWHSPNKPNATTFYNFIRGSGPFGSVLYDTSWLWKSAWIPSLQSLTAIQDVFAQSLQLVRPAIPVISCAHAVPVVHAFAAAFA